MLQALVARILSCKTGVTMPENNYHGLHQLLANDFVYCMMHIFRAPFVSD